MILCSVCAASADELVELWDPAIPFPYGYEEIPVLPYVRYSSVHWAVAGEWQYLHQAGLGFHENMLFAGWAHALEDEGSPEQMITGRRSTDGGRTWTPTEVIGPEIEGIDRLGFCTFFSHQGRMWAFGSKRNSHQMVAYYFHPRDHVWIEEGVVLAEPGWTATDRIRRMENGNHILAGGVASNQIAISDGDDLTQWRIRNIPHDPELRFPLISLIIEDNEIWAIMRNSQASFALVSRSYDYGETWEEARMSNFPMSPARPFAGMLSTGERYVISSTPRDMRSESRQALTIALSRPGEKQLSRIWRISRGTPHHLRHPGHAKGRQWSYPQAVEHDGNLYVIYSVNKEDAEMAVIPLEAFEEIEMDGTRRHWSNPAGGIYQENSNWQGGVPAVDQEAWFDLGQLERYTVLFQSSAENRGTLIGNDHVVFQLGENELTVREDLSVTSGLNSSGSLEVHGGSTRVEGNLAVSGDIRFEDGTLLLDGTLQLSGEEGRQATGQFRGDASAMIQNRFDVGRDGPGFLELTGQGTEVTVEGTRPRVGRNAPGVLIVREGASLTVTDDLRISWGGANGEVSSLWVDDAQLTVGGGFHVGDGPTTIGKARFSSGASATISNRFDIGREGPGELEVTGPGTTLTVGGVNSRIGRNAPGMASISDGAAVNVGGDLRIAWNGSAGDLSTLTMDAAVLTVEGNLIAGDHSATRAEISMRNGSSAAVAGAILGHQGDARLELLGEGTTLTLAGTLQVGNNAPAEIRLAGGTIEAGDIFFSPGASLVTILGESPGSVIKSDAGVTIAAGVDLHVDWSGNFIALPGTRLPLIQSGAGVDGFFSGLPDGHVLEAGGYEFEIHYEGEEVALIVLRADVAFTDWVSRFGLPEDQWSPEANPAGDGISNAVKYALGLDPGKVEVERFPGAVIETLGEDAYLVLDIPRNPVASEAEFQVEVSDDLSGWRSGSASVTIIEETDTRLRVKSNHRIADLEQQFMRLKIELD